MGSSTKALAEDSSFDFESFEEAVRNRIPKVIASIEEAYAHENDTAKGLGFGIPHTEVSRIEEMLLPHNERYAYEKLLRGTLSIDRLGIQNGVKPIDYRCQALAIYINSVSNESTAMSAAGLAHTEKVKGFLDMSHELRAKGLELEVQLRNAVKEYFATRSANDTADAKPFSPVTNAAIEVAKHADSVAKWIANVFMPYELEVLNFSRMEGSKDFHFFGKK